MQTKREGALQGLLQPVQLRSQLKSTESVSHEVVSDSLQPGLLCPWDSPDKNTGVSCHFPLQGIFPAQG